MPGGDADHRALSRKIANGLWKITLIYTGIGIAMETLIESTVRVTIRHSDNPPIASEAATAWVSPDEATGAERLLKPAAPGDRIMAGFPRGCGRITRDGRQFYGNRGQYCGAASLENGEIAAVSTDMPAIYASAAMPA